MRLIAFFTALALGAATPLAASELFDWTPAGKVQAAEAMASGKVATATATAPTPPTSPSSAIGKIAATPAAPTAKDPATQSQSADNQIEEWIGALAKNEGFEAWQDASWVKYPLGPGKRGWVVIIRDAGDASDGHEIGYMIVVDGPEHTLQLEEYGLSDAPLFSLRTLTRSLGTSGLEGTAFSKAATFERIYVDALHAYWKVSEGKVTRYADAMTGVWLPIGKRDVESLASAQAGALNSLPPPSKQLHWIAQTVADPYMNLGWLTAKPQPINSWGELDHIARGKRMPLVYRADLYADSAKLLITFAVAGIHAWQPNGESGGKASESMPLRGYVALEQEGLRYVSFNTLISNGTFR
jgi:hypothetical protein